MTASASRLAVDIGGTFTDVVLDTGDRLATIKTLTTYDDPARGVMQGVRDVLAETGVAPGAINVVLHGTTLATNALIERSGAVTGLITTDGHRDALEMAYENRFEQYDVNVDRPEPLVPRHLRLGVRERLDAGGRVRIELDQPSVEAAVRTLVDYGAQSIAVGLIHGYANPAHEHVIADIIDRVAPELYVTLASDVCPEIREFERLSTTCANAYVKPLMSRYLTSLENELSAAGLRCPCLMMTSGGGLTSLDIARQFPIRLVESGPAGGAILAAHIARRDSVESVLSFDMGGTTAKICLIDGGEPQYSRAFEVDRSYRFKKGSGLPVRIPVIEMVEIGAGGGSIASVDKLGRVQVGPASAGSEPGPASYGRGGSSATVSDADAALGYLLPEFFGGGSLSLTPSLAVEALDRDIGGPLAADTTAAAVAVAEIVNENMAAAARAHAAEWGRETEGRTLIAFGGAAPLHAAEIAEKLKLDTVIVPGGAGVGSAVGFLIAPVAYEVVRSRYMRLSAFDTGAANAVLDDMLAEARAVVTPVAGDRPLTAHRRVFMRYAGQGYEIAVDLPDGDLTGNSSAQVGDAFETNYRHLYGRVIPGLDVEILSWTLTLATPASDIGAGAAADESAWLPESGSARVFDLPLRDVVPAAVWQRSAMRVGNVVPGPALIVDGQTTIVVNSRFDARATATGDITMTRVQQAR